MKPTLSTSPESAIALISAVAALLYLLTRKIRQHAANAAPDPWPAEIEHAIRAPDAIPLCINCLSSQEGVRWFCPRCGYPTGEYVTLMPYLQIFATGEVLRRGVMGPPEKGIGRIVFLIIYSVSEYGLFAPVYWFWLARKAVGKPICYESRANYDLKEIT